MNVAPNFEPMLLWHRPHPSLHAKSSCLNSLCNGDLALLERQIYMYMYHQAMTKNRPHLLLCSRLRATEQASQITRRFTLFIQECISMATLICAHSTTILTNHEPSELVAERIVCALQVRTWTI